MAREARHRRPHRDLRDMENRQSLPLPELTEIKLKNTKPTTFRKITSHFYSKKFARPVVSGLTTEVVEF